MASQVADSLVNAQRLADSTILVLRAQLEATQAFQTDLLTTVYWALGGVFVLVGLLLAVGWYSNFRVYRRDLDALRKELSLRLAEELREARSNLEESVTGQVKRQASRIEGSLRGRVETLEAKANRLKLEKKADEVEERRAANRHSMAATSALSLLRSALSARDDIWTPRALRALMESIESGGRLTETEFRSAKELLDRVPDGHQVLKDRATDALRRAELF